MRAIVINTRTHAGRMETLRDIAAVARHCDSCAAVAATLMCIFKAAVNTRGLSELDCRRMRNELTPADATADELEFIDRFLGDLGARPNP